MRIRLPDGSEVPFTTVADGRGGARLRHHQPHRSAAGGHRVTADVDEAVANANEINRTCAKQRILPDLIRPLPRPLSIPISRASSESSRTSRCGSLR